MPAIATARMLRQAEHAFERRQLAIDRRVRRQRDLLRLIARLAMLHVGPNIAHCKAGEPPPGEVGRQALPEAPVQRSTRRAH